jgi:hydrogenase-4 transcriptional activator
VRLLRVLQDGEFTRVGGKQVIKTDVRVVAATNTDLERAVDEGTFRKDLYYRLSVFPIVIPPLRDRPSDVRAFAAYFAERAANRFGVRPVPVSEEDVRLLAEYRWPGNVREMAAVMDRAVLIGQGQMLSVEAALGQAPRARAAAASGVTVQGRRDSDTTPIPASGIEPLEVVMRRHIETALRATQGRVEGPHGAARLLRINPHTLRARMRKLKINWRGFRM